MKELTSYNRVAGYLNKIFDLLNDAYFESALSRPTITIQSTPKAYGHFSLREDTWLSKNGATHEINIGAGTLSRPIEEVKATLLHADKKKAVTEEIKKQTKPSIMEALRRGMEEQRKKDSEKQAQEKQKKQNMEL